MFPRHFEEVIRQDGFIYTATQIGNEPTGHTAMQALLYPHLSLIESFFWVLWVSILFYMVRKLWLLSTKATS